MNHPVKWVSRPNKEKCTYAFLFLWHMAYGKTYPLESLLNLSEQFSHPLPNEIDHCVVVHGISGVETYVHCVKLCRLINKIYCRFFTFQSHIIIFSRSCNLRRCFIRFRIWIHKPRVSRIIAEWDATLFTSGKIKEPL